MSEPTRDPNEFGALWVKKGAKGLFLSGYVGGQDVICFPVTGGQEPGSKTPAWRILKSDPRPDRPRHGRAPRDERPAPPPEPQGPPTDDPFA